MRKTVAAAAMAGALTIGAGAGAVLFAPDLVNAQTDDTTEEPTETERPEPGQWLRETLAPLVEDGTITQAQADAVIDAIQEAKPDRVRGPGNRFPILEDVTGVLGMTAEELREALAGGQTLAEIAADRGVSVDDVVAAIVATMEERIAGAVEDGRLTQEEADEKLADATEKATEIVNGEFEGRFDGRGPGGPRGHGGPFGPGDDQGADDGSGTTDETDDTVGS